MRSKIKNIFSISQLYDNYGMFRGMRRIKLYRNVYYSDETSRTNRLQNICRIRINLYSKNIMRAENIHYYQTKSLQERAKNVRRYL